MAPTPVRVGQESFAVDRPVDHTGSADAVVAQRYQERQYPPAHAKCLGDQPLTGARTTVAERMLVLAQVVSRPRPLSIDRQRQSQGPQAYSVYSGFFVDPRTGSRTRFSFDVFCRRSRWLATRAKTYGRPAVKPMFDATSVLRACKIASQFRSKSWKPGDGLLASRLVNLNRQVTDET